MWHNVKTLNKKTISSIHKGELAQLKIELEAAKRGYGISVPSIPLRYDLIIEKDNQLYRTQIKYLTRKGKGKDSLELLLYHALRKEVYTSKEIDLLLVYIPKIDSILYFTPKQFHNKKSLTINLSNEKSTNYYKNFLW